MRPGASNVSVPYPRPGQAEDLPVPVDRLGAALRELHDLGRCTEQIGCDGVRVAQLLVAVRKALMAVAAEGDKPRHASTIARIAEAISGNSGDFVTVLPGFPARTAKPQPVPARLRTRRWRWQCSTPSWPAAYNLACAYAAVAAHADEDTQPDPLIKKWSAAWSWRCAG